MIDEELLNAMANGIIVSCPDGLQRCFYPHFLTYSADYPEKQVFPSACSCTTILLTRYNLPRCLIATIRNNGTHACHRCLVGDTKGEISKLGTPADVECRQNLRNASDDRTAVDSAIEEIYINRFAVDGSRVEALLKERSLVPVKVSAYQK